MIIGDRLRALREERNYSQAEMENRTGLLRCYISRVEHGHTVPSIETLEKVAAALEVPLYRLFYAGKDPPTLFHFSKAKNRSHDAAWGSRGKNARLLSKLRRLFGLMHDRDIKLLFSLVGEMANRKNRAVASKKKVSRA
jgi:transcriptional regulator with XRE-family HTH domain